MTSNNLSLHQSESQSHLSSMSSENSEMDEKEIRTILGDLEATRKYWETKTRPTNNLGFVAQPRCKHKAACQPAVIVRRRNAYMKLDNQLATAYFPPCFLSKTYQQSWIILS